MSPRWGIAIDVTKCIGCRTCVVACKEDNDVNLKLRRNWVTTVGPIGIFPQVEMFFLPLLCMHCEKPPCVEACPNQALHRREDGIVLADEEKCLGCQPCLLACPAGASPRSYVCLIAQGRFEEAMEAVRRVIPFPGVCGRVCKHPCETDCRRKEVDDPIAIADLKRFLADWELKNGSQGIVPAQRTKQSQVAVIGSGPAGLTAASDLVRMGYGVTVFEAQPVAGGMMSLGIPAYRLPKDILHKEIDALVKLGIEIKTNTRLGVDITLDGLLKGGYRAVFVAAGAQRSLPLRIEGEQYKGVVSALDFLRQVNLGKGPKMSGRVLVIGGGDVAIDAARSSLRLGAGEVHVVCLESRKEMPAEDEEVERALEEGVVLHPSLGPKRILGRDGKVVGLETIRVESVFDKTGDFNPTFIPDTESTMNADAIIVAIGQSPDLSLIKESDGVKVTPQGKIAVDPQTLATSRSAVFAGGDVVGSGPMNIVNAIAAGHKAAGSIDSYLSGQAVEARVGAVPRPIEKPVNQERIEKKPRQQMPSLSVAQRLKGFSEMELGFTEDMAIEEAKRCLACAACVESCPYQAILLDAKRDKIEKCTLCFGRIEAGDMPTCVKACTGKALTFGDLNDPNSEISKLIAEKQAFRLLPHLDTQPSIYYIYRRAIESW